MGEERWGWHMIREYQVVNLLSLSSKSCGVHDNGEGWLSGEGEASEGRQNHHHHSEIAR